jgi:hypothetical protein
VNINRRLARLEQAAQQAAQGRADAELPWEVFPTRRARGAATAAGWGWCR